MDNIKAFVFPVMWAGLQLGFLELWTRFQSSVALQQSWPKLAAVASSPEDLMDVLHSEALNLSFLGYIEFVPRAVNNCPLKKNVWSAIQRGLFIQFLLPLQHRPF